LEEIIAKAVKNKTTADDDEKRVRKIGRKMNGLLYGLRLYLQWNAWGPSRSEAIISGLPPSPYLDHLID
jgi:hypothetical protein